MGYCKYKDALPEVTIEKAKEIFKILGISYDLKLTKKAEGIYSAVLYEPNGKWITCGKGTTEKYCEASAWGEAVEHLCNYTAYNMMNLSKEAKEFGGFDHYPDEIVMDIDKLPLEAPELFEDVRKAYLLASGYIVSDTMICALLKTYFGKESLPAIPFWGIKNKEVRYFPEVLIYNLCGSNGGGAGNTAQEAIGHGLDEITERYVKEKIYHEMLTPPTISKKYINNRCPELAETIRDIEIRQGVSIVVKDASMGKGFPVICVVMIDKKNQTYLANFGSHPRFEIALERCLTELLQAYEVGDNIAVRKDMSRWTDISDKMISSTRNWISLLRDDVGYIPDTFFAGTPSWDFVEWNDYEEYSNMIGMKEQIVRLGELSSEIYVRNNSFFDFCSYKVYIPGISTTALPFNERHLHCYKLNEKINDYIRNGTDFSEEVKLDLLNNYFHPDMFMGTLSYASMGDYMWYSLYASLLICFGKEKEAIDILSAQNNKICLSGIRVLQLKKKNYSKDSILELLEMFYNPAEIEYATCWIGDNAFECLINKYVKGCYDVRAQGIINEGYDALNELHINLKKYMTQNIVSQDGAFYRG